MKIFWLYSIHENKNIYESNLASVDGGVLFRSFGKEEEPGLISESAVAIANGLIDDRRGSGPSEAILLHNASQLLITSVNLPLSSPISTCNAWTACISQGKKSIDLHNN